MLLRYDDEFTLRLLVNRTVCLEVSLSAFFVKIVCVSRSLLE